MSPARPRRNRNTAPLRRDPREQRLAIAACAALVLATLLLIWAMRPGGSGTAIYGNGGVFNRQPRVGLFLVLLIGAVLGVVAFARRPHKLDQAKRVLSIGLPIVAVVAVLGGIFWPGDLVKDYAQPPKPLKDLKITTTTAPRGATTTQPGVTTTTASGSTTTKASTSTTAAPATTSTSKG